MITSISFKTEQHGPCPRRAHAGPAWICPLLFDRNALRRHALQVEEAHGGAGRKDEDDAAEAAREGSARVASRRCRPPLAGGATTGSEAGRRPRLGSRARRVEMDRIGFRV